MNTDHTVSNKPTLLATKYSGTDNAGSGTITPAIIIINVTPRPRNRYLAKA
jgi:hypothetical protein